MDVNQIRLELTAQHGAIREEISRLLATLDGLGSEEEVRELNQSLELLRQLVEAHNEHEESLLRGLVRSMDAWGEIRERLMDEHHTAEHVSMLAGLAACANLQDAATARRCADELLCAILEHLEHEENELLSPDFLRDDIINVQPFGG